jgi:hypothetical protein
MFGFVQGERTAFAIFNLSADHHPHSKMISHMLSQVPVGGGLQSATLKRTAGTDKVTCQMRSNMFEVCFKKLSRKIVTTMLAAVHLTATLLYLEERERLYVERTAFGFMEEGRSCYWQGY